MNYLSHYFLDRHRSTPYFVFGAALPDMVRNYRDENIRFFPKKLPPPADALQRELVSGIRRHFDADALFHTADFFKHYSARLKHYLETGEYDSPRRRTYALAHVLMEIVLDKLLLQNHPTDVASYYEKLEAVRKEKVFHFLESNALSKTPEKLWLRFDFFRQSRFLYNYADGDALIRIADHTAQGIGNPPMSGAEKERVGAALSQIEHDLAPHYLSIFAHLQKELSD